MGPEFVWPKDDEIPEDIQSINRMNGVHWSHEFQDAAVGKLIEFLKLPVVSGIRRRPQRRLSGVPSLTRYQSIKFE